VTYWHVADASELTGLDPDGGANNLQVLAGTKSMWLGHVVDTAVPFCSWATPPGYGNDWDQTLMSDQFFGNRITINYLLWFDSEENYDGTKVQYTFNAEQGDLATWVDFPIGVIGAPAGRIDWYEGILVGYQPKLSEPPRAETFTVDNGGTDANLAVRFRFVADGSWSDEDGFRGSDGAIVLDNLQLIIKNAATSTVYNSTDPFDNTASGASSSTIWTGMPTPGYGDFAQLYSAENDVLQEDPCQFVVSWVWGFFDTAVNNPYLCRLPEADLDQGTLGYLNTRDQYIHNAVWSPPFSNTATIPGSPAAGPAFGNEYRLDFEVYRDLPLDNLIFYERHLRSWNWVQTGPTDSVLCPGAWRNENLASFGPDRDWFNSGNSAQRRDLVGPFIDPNAPQIQVSIGSYDLCRFWCGVFGTGECHSHAPLLNFVRVERISTAGPQWTLRDFDLFQDTFPDATVEGNDPLTGTGRADSSNDVNPLYNAVIVPGDSIRAQVTQVREHTAGNGPAVYGFIAVKHAGRGHAATHHDPASIASPDARPGNVTALSPRWPYRSGLDFVSTDGVQWRAFQFDTLFSSSGIVVSDVYCLDLNDDLFQAGDTICYFYGADESGGWSGSDGSESFYTRGQGGFGFRFLTSDQNEAALSAMEFQILPSTGHFSGGDILYVDAADDRSGPPQYYFDTAFEQLGVLGKIDRYDVNGPSSDVGNSLGGRMSAQSQLTNIYKKIIWNTGTLSEGLVCDGSGDPSKANDWSRLLSWFDNQDDGAPGIYFSGDDLATEWNTQRISGNNPDAATFRDRYLPHNLLGADPNRSDHIEWGEPVSPVLTAETGSIFDHGVAGKDVLVAYGGCLTINNFDVLEPVGTTTIEMAYPNSGDAAILANTDTTDVAGELGTVILSGFSYNFIRDDVLPAPGEPTARVEHLKDILNHLGNATGTPTGITPGKGPQYANALDNNYPNPFNPTTTIKYSIKTRAHVSLRVYNAAGQLVKTLVDQVQSPEQVQPVTWDGRSNAGQTVSSGVYFYKLVTKNFSSTKKLVLLK
jgi:hypothetical protein